MKVLITGGTGLIGTALINKLGSGHDIWVLTRHPYRNLESTSEFNPTYIESIDALSTVTLDAIVNLAGEPIADKRWAPAQKERITYSRWKTTQDVVNYIQSSSTPPKTLISGSAIGYYGRQSDQPVFEDFDSPTPEFSHILCHRWEEIALEAHSTSTRVCLLRTGIVLDASKGALAKMLPPFKFGLGGPMADGHQYMSWIHIQDMVDAICFLLDNEKCEGAYNLTAPNPVNNLEFSRALAAHLHRPCVLPMPKFVLRLLFGEMADLLIYGQNVIPKRLMDEGFKFQYPTLDSAFEHLIKHND